MKYCTMRMNFLHGLIFIKKKNWLINGPEREVEEGISVETRVE